MIILSILILNVLVILNCVKAVQINSANIVSQGDCGSLLIYKGIVVKAYYAAYIQNGVSYPAYCLDKNKKGVDNEISYPVSVQNAITDVKLWRIIINGYPYKSISELGCANKEEAFTATKQAIYCYIHGNNPSDYIPIGEAGQRTLNALNKILSDAQNCSETQISNSVKIIKEQENFDIDEKETEYISKVYSIKVGTKIKDYKIKLESESVSLDGVKITDLNNNSKEKFSQNEKFKILIPIKNLTRDADFIIKLETQIENKPVLYGQAGNNEYQDYALTAETYEDAIGETKDIYYENKTKLKIIKQDENTKERLENIEFNILNSNKEIVFANVKTDSNGEIQINHLQPGKYYIQETVTKDGYIINEELLEIEISFNQELVLTINNSFEEKPQIEVTEKSISKTVAKKLPVTGM